jgi:hypothetical protein
MGRVPKLVDGLTEELHQELGLELTAVWQAMRDVRTLLTRAEGSGSEAYGTANKVLMHLRALAVLLDRDLRDRFGAKIELRKCYREIVQ